MPLEPGIQGRDRGDFHQGGTREQASPEDPSRESGVLPGAPINEEEMRIGW